MDWRSYIGPAMALPAKLVGAPWWAVLAVVLAILGINLSRQLCQFRLGRQALNKAAQADIPAVTAAIMQRACGPPGGAPHRWPGRQPHMARRLPF